MAIVSTLSTLNEIVLRDSVFSKNSSALSFSGIDANTKIYKCIISSNTTDTGSIVLPARMDNVSISGNTCTDLSMAASASTASIINKCSVMGNIISGTFTLPGALAVFSNDGNQTIFIGNTANVWSSAAGSWSIGATPQDNIFAWGNNQATLGTVSFNGTGVTINNMSTANRVSSSGGIGGIEC
jgi:hypothetical protein